MSEIQATYATLMEIDKLLAEIELKISNITGEKTGGGGGGGSALTLRQDVKMLNIALSMLERSTGSADVDKAINKFRQVTMIAIRAKMAIQAVQLAMIPGAGWMEALWAGFNVASLGMSTYDAFAGQ